uniref:Reverse transcriptase domain-containing protein n=1 Tax=Xenopus tropicalis TaxID=8364 RepID=A0A803J2H9_XENTR
MVANISLAPRICSDHAPLQLELRLREGKGNMQWRLPPKWITHKFIQEAYKTQIKEFWEINAGTATQQVVWDTSKAYTRGAYISLIKEARRLQDADLESLRKAQGEAEEAYTNDPTDPLGEALETAQRDVNLAYVHKYTQWELKKAATWYEKGDKCGKLLAILAREPTHITSIPRLISSRGQEVLRQDQITAEFAHYYSTLYDSKINYPPETLTQYLSETPIPTLSQVEAEVLNREINLEEVTKAIDSFPNGKSPGPDGLPIEWYKTNKDIVAPQLCNLYNMITQGAHLPESMRMATITLILKQGKPPERCESYRPISLLNSDVKILAKVLANRLKTVIELLIHPDQTGFMPSKATDINIRRLFTNIWAKHDVTGERVVVALDTEKAFDTVEWSYLWALLTRYGLGSQFISWVKALYESPSARIMVNSELSQAFPLKRGTRQGCPLSPFLFALAIEPLAIKIRNNAGIQGLKLQRVEEKISLYADDMLIYLANPKQPLTELLTEVIRFGGLSGLRVNWAKSLVFPIDNEAARDPTHGPQLQWVTSFTYLGIVIHKDPKKFTERNLTPPLKSLRTKLQHWASLPLSLPGRINILKMIWLPKFLYLFHNAPILPAKKWFREIDVCVREFIWAGERPRIKMPMLEAPVKKGGLALPNFLLYFYASQLVYANWWFNPDPNNQATVLEAAVVSSFEALANQIYRGIPSIHPLTPPMKTLIQVFSRTVKATHQKANSWSKWTPLWGNNTLTQFKTFPDANLWAAAGVKRLHDVVEAGGIKRYAQLKEEFNLQNHMLFRYLQLKHAFQIQFPREPPIITESTLERYLHRPNLLKPLSWFYAILLQGSFDSVNHIRLKWAQDFPQLDNEVWKDILEQITETNIATRDRYIQVKFLNRVYLTPHRLARIYQGYPDVCVKCNVDQGNYIHVFWDCPKIQQYWTTILTFMGSSLGLPNIRTPEFCLLGHTEGLTLPSGDRICLQQLLHYAKKAILLTWKNMEPPTLGFWIKLVDDTLPRQKLTYLARGCPAKFDKIWSCWLTVPRTNNVTH